MNMTATGASASASLIDSYADRLAAAHAWKQAGGKVIGYITPVVPREIITAAGMFPLLIAGDPTRKISLGDTWMEEQFDPMASSIFDAAVNGELQFLDLLIVPRVADSFMRLYLYLREVERSGDVKVLPRVMQLDLLQTRHYSSGIYNLERIRELRSTLAEISGQPISDAQLSAAITTANQGRALIRKLTSQRQAVPPLIAGSTALQLIGSLHFVRTDDSVARLPQALDAATHVQPANNLRIVVAGNAQDSTVLYEMLEARGFSIVGDYHWMGDIESRFDIGTAGDPWLALSDHYHHDSLTSRRFPHQPEEIVHYAQASGAHGVLFYLFEQEEALTWDCPGQVRALAAAGIQSVVLADQPYLPVATPAVLAELDKFRTSIVAAAKTLEATV